MNIAIIGPERSGKSFFAAWFAKRAKGGRVIKMFGGYNSKFPPISFEEFGIEQNIVVIVDDANAFLDSYEFNRKNNPMRKNNYQHRHWNRLNIYVFHSVEDSIKKVLRQCKYVYISDKYQGKRKTPSLLEGISPNLVGRKGFQFLEYKRY